MPDQNLPRENIGSRGRTGARRTILRVLIAGLVVFTGMQFLRPSLTNPPVTADLQAPPEVKRILRNSCYSCHSNETRLPWFDQIVPAYWLVANDVNEARQHLNFSTLGAAPPETQRAVLFEAVTQIQLGAMPLPSYRMIHPGSVVTPEQLAVLRAYVNASNSLSTHP